MKEIKKEIIGELYGNQCFNEIITNTIIKNLPADCPMEERDALAEMLESSLIVIFEEEEEKG